MGRVFLVVAAFLAGGLVATVEAGEPATPEAGFAAGTPAPLDESTVQSLAIQAFGPDIVLSGPMFIFVASESVGLRPGEARILALGVFDFESCGPIGNRCFTPVPVDAHWSVFPRDGAAIDGAGLLTIAPDTPHGRVYTVRADIENGRRLVETEVFVYTQEGNPFVGIWTEDARFACGSGVELQPEVPVEELTFAADGTFTLTWKPFESYVDYWGTYEFDVTRGAFALSVTGGNAIPPDLDGRGRFELDSAGRLRLAELWLGSPPPGLDAATPAAGGPPCGHRFVFLTGGQ